MDDFDLDKLSKTKTPKPSDSARDKAVFAAMDAFDEVHAKNNSSETQGSEEQGRQTSVFNKLWNSLMSFTSPTSNFGRSTAILTGVVLVPFAALIGYQVWQDDGPGAAPANLEIERQSLSESKAQDTNSDLIKQFPMAKEERLQVTSGSPKPVIRAKERAVGQLQDGVAQSFRKPSPSFAPSQPRIRIEPLPVPGASYERYTEFDDNGVKRVVTEPISTFSIDVDTASYSRVRRSLMAGQLPPKDMVRVEEMVNYFDYNYPLPENKSQPFRTTYAISKTPWNDHTQLLHIGVKGFDVVRDEQPAANLVFLLDVSGSMNSPDKLPLLISSFKLLLTKLNPTDTVSIVTYAGGAGIALEPTKVSDKSKIIDAMERLRAGGSTAGAQGIEQAYELAEKSFVKDGVNRVMLATDGDFNVGINDPKELKDFIAKKRKSGVFLSVFGFGQGNYNDALMQSLAQNGNGTAAYIDTLAEAQKTLVEEAGSTLFPIAKDVKIQMEFDPAKIAEYRLIGYETRALKREDFNNDKVDAGDIGAGHSVTAIYELTPVGSAAVLNDPLRYGNDAPKVATAEADGSQGEIGFLKLRYKLPNEDKSKLITTPIESAIGCTVCKINPYPNDSSFATAVAAFGQKLRGNPAVEDMSYEDIATLATTNSPDLNIAYRRSFVQLVRMAGSLTQ